MSPLLKVFVCMCAYAMVSFAGIVFLFLRKKKVLAWVLTAFTIVMLAVIISLLVININLPHK